MSDNTLLFVYADAQSMLARLEERRRLSVVRRPWKIRCFIAERQALAWVDATTIDDSMFTVDGRGAVGGAEFDLTHWRQAVGANVTLETIQTNDAGLLDWLGVQDSGAATASWGTAGWPLDDIRQRVRLWQQDVAALPPSPPLIHGARMASAWRRFSPIGRGDAVASFLIGDRYGPGRWDASFGGLVALGFQKRGAAWKIAQGAKLELLWLHAIADGARHHLDWEMRLRAYAGRARAHILSRRRPGRLKEVIAMAMSRPYINSRMVSERLDITSAGAIKLLTNAVEAGLLLERSGQNSYRTYAIPLGPGAAAASSRSDPMNVDTPNFWNDDENTLPSEAR